MALAVLSFAATFFYLAYTMVFVVPFYPLIVTMHVVRLLPVLFGGYDNSWKNVRFSCSALWVSKSRLNSFVNSVLIHAAPGSFGTFFDNKREFLCCGCNSVKRAFACK